MASIRHIEFKKFRFWWFAVVRVAGYSVLIFIKIGLYFTKMWQYNDFQDGGSLARGREGLSSPPAGRYTCLGLVIWRHDFDVRVPRETSLSSDVSCNLYYPGTRQPEWQVLPAASTRWPVLVYAAQVCRLCSSRPIVLTIFNSPRMVAKTYTTEINWLN